ncbi:MAG: cyclic nucleotide-binding domain-containing protein [Fibrobacter sp.]|nr:cyclic nucleotide-binding domain-containing protein [Fibrobacter sp.]
MISSANVEISEILPILKSVTIFSGFNEEQLRNICEKCTYVNVEGGDIILEENKPATEIFIILKGKVTIILNIHENPLEIVEFSAGNCIGEASVVGIQPHSASAMARERSTLLVLSRQVLMQLYDSDKSLFSLLILNIARELARRLYRTDVILQHYGKEHHHRIAEETIQQEA